MAIHRLQEKIRKLKNPTVVNFSVLSEHIPPHILEAAGSFALAYKQFCKELLEGLKDIVPAVRFDFNSFAMLGGEGLDALEEVLNFAGSRGYYVLLDGVQTLSSQDARRAAQVFLGENCRWRFDGLVVSSYIGSDGLLPYTAALGDKDLFVVIRTSNRTAPEIQDLMTGSRLVHMANADIVNRFVQPLTGKSGYSQVAVMAAASSPDSLRALRAKYQNIFLMLDGCDYPNANAKNCSYAFDNLGHGAAACAGLSITAAWKEESDTGTDYVSQGVEAALRLKRNLTRYVTVL